MREEVQNQTARRMIRQRQCEDGFGLLEALIVLAIIGIIASFATFNIVQARADMRRINSARQFAGYLERARADSIRRHADQTPVDTRASVTVIDANTFRVDFDGGLSGGLAPQDFDFDAGVSFATADFGTTIRFDWRGQTGGESINIVNSAAPADASRTSIITVSGLGDIGINETYVAPQIADSTTVPTPMP